MTCFHSLSDEILSEVFSHLELRCQLQTIPLVCKRWQAAAKQPSALWRVLTVNLSELYPPSVALQPELVQKWLCQRVNQAQELHVIGSQVLQASQWGALLAWATTTSQQLRHGAAPPLRTLRLDHCCDLVTDTAVMAAVARLAGLQELYISGLSRSIPQAALQALSPLTSLRALEISCETESAVTETGCCCLTCQGVLLDGFPACIAGLTALTSLRLTSDGISCIPAAIVSLQQLQRLDLERCAVREVCAEVGQLRALAWLNLQDNFLGHAPDPRRCLPASLAHYTTLTHLDLGFNNLSTLPRAVGLLRWLKTLILDGNCLGDALLGSSETSLAALSGLTSLSRLSWRWDSLVWIPTVVYSLPALEVLDVAHNKLVRIDADHLPKLGKLHALDVSCNMLSEGTWLELFQMADKAGRMCLKF